jgi:hypothetical protein
MVISPEGSLEREKPRSKREVGRYKYLVKGRLSDHMLHRYQLSFLSLAFRLRTYRVIELSVSQSGDEHCVDLSILAVACCSFLYR